MRIAIAAATVVALALSGEARAQARTSAVDGSGASGAWPSSVVAAAVANGASHWIDAVSVSAHAWAAARNR